MGDEVLKKDKATFVDEGGTGHGAREREDDDARFRGVGVAYQESKADVQGGDDLAGVFLGEEERGEEGGDAGFEVVR